MLSVGTLLLLLGAAIGMRWRIAALGCAIVVVTICAFVFNEMNGGSFWASVGWAAYASLMLQAGYLTASLIATRFFNPRKPAVKPACS
jgi:hypothetical protein